MAPRRNGATLAVLADADLVLAVGSCDPAGLERLIRGLAELADAVPEVNPQVVLNRCRSAVGSTAEAEAALDRFAGVRVMARLPEDRAATDRAWRRGVSLAEAAPRSPLRTAARDLARIADAGAGSRPALSIQRSDYPVRMAATGAALEILHAVAERVTS